MATETTTAAPKEPKKLNDASEDRRLLRLVADLARREAVRQRQPPVPRKVESKPTVEGDPADVEGGGAPAVPAYLLLRGNFRILIKESIGVNEENKLVYREVRHIFESLKIADGGPGAAGRAGISPAEIKKDGSNGWYVPLSANGMAGSPDEETSG